MNIFFFNYFRTDSGWLEESNTETDDINHDSESNDSLAYQLKRIKEKVEEIRPRFDTFENGFSSEETNELTDILDGLKSVVQKIHFRARGVLRRECTICRMKLQEYSEKLEKA